MKDKIIQIIKNAIVDSIQEQEALQELNNDLLIIQDDNFKQEIKTNVLKIQKERYLIHFLSSILTQIERL